tara:strand:+ start:972 stop:1310 length:339 start_codon:yes stop_codon:yes gene_type:complete
MPNKLFYDLDELTLIYNEALASLNGDLDDVDESVLYGSTDVELDLDTMEEIELDNYTIEFSAEEEVIFITLEGLVSDDFNDEDITVFTEIIEDEDGDITYTPYQFLDALLPE